jgi:Tol biopolymer transport system component
MSRRRLLTSRSQVGTEDKPRTIAVESAPSATVGKGRRIAALLLRFGAVFAPIVGVVVAIFLGGAIAGPTGEAALRGIMAAGEKPASQVDVKGRLLMPLDGDLWLMNLQSRQLEKVVRARPSGTVSSARWAPDGRSVAYALDHSSPGQTAIQSEIYVTDFSSDHVLVEHEGLGSAVGLPAWAPDGRAMYFGASGLEDGRLVQHIDRFGLSVGSRDRLTDGVLPDVSPDGMQLAFVRRGLDGDSLLLSQTNGDSPQILIPPSRNRMRTLDAPRISPDGKMVAIPATIPSGEARAPSPSGLFGLLGTSVAFAHGDPWDVFLVTTDGGQPRRLTNLMEDEMSVAWSPDGTELAIYASRGLYLADLKGSTTMLHNGGGYGGIDWTR